MSWSKSTVKLRNMLLYTIISYLITVIIMVAIQTISPTLGIYTALALWPTLNYYLFQEDELMGKTTENRLFIWVVLYTYSFLFFSLYVTLAGLILNVVKDVDLF